MSSAELARELDMRHAAVSFHVRQLAAAGYLELVETRSVRGGQERCYRTRAAGQAEWSHEDPRLVIRAVGEEVSRRAADSPPKAWRLFGDAELWVDPAVWDDTVKRITTAMNDLHAAALEPRTPEAKHVSATTMLFAIESGVLGEPDGMDPGAPATHHAVDPGAPATRHAIDAGAPHMQSASDKVAPKKQKR
jgi:DNA-binding transcriptional ArsR family regulator